MTPGGPLAAEARLLILPFVCADPVAEVNAEWGRGKSWILLTNPRAGSPFSSLACACPFAAGSSDPLRVGDRGLGRGRCTGANERRSSAMRHSRICPSQLPDANRSAYGRAASDVIHRGACIDPSVSELEISTPWASGWLKMGFFFVVDQSEMVLHEANMTDAQKRRKKAPKLSVL